AFVVPSESGLTMVNGSTDPDLTISDFDPATRSADSKLVTRTLLRSSVFFIPSPPEFLRDVAFSLLFRQIQRWVVREEVNWPQFKLVPNCGHHRPIFGMWHVVETHGVPQHSVGVLDPTIVFGPSWQPASSVALHRVVAGAVALLLNVRGHPNLIIGEARALL